jgi:hypothetical protein
MARARREPRDEEHKPEPEDVGDEDDGELQDEDFQFALKELLAAYEPILAEELERARSPERLSKEAREHPPSCEDEFELATRLFDRFFTDEVAQRLLPQDGRKQLGPFEEWSWCARHIRCCIIFGWLVCRGPRTFRASNYYLYRYWRCVRQALDVPVSEPLTDEEHRDFTTLVEALAVAYKPYLTDQLATVEFTHGIPDEVIEGEIDCLEGLEESAAVFERLLTVEVAAALLGRKVFDDHYRDPRFWFCRCWCLCAIRFGCCLARARSLRDVHRCLVLYRRCLRQCFRPLQCDITHPAPSECAEEQILLGAGTIGIEIVGTATGAFCDHYILEWKAAGAPDTDYSSSGIIYDPPGLTEGACGKVNATLGYLSTGLASVGDDVTVRLRVVAAPPSSAEQPCTVTFQIFRRRVFISGIEGVTVASPPGVYDPSADLKTGTTLRSFGSALEIWGHAWVGKCAGREIKRYTLAYQPGFVTDPTLGPWTEFWQVDYQTPLQKKAEQTLLLDLTSFWLHLETCVVPNPMPPPECLLSIPYDELWPTRWQSGRNYPDVPVGLQSFPVDPEVPAVVWTSQQLPFVNCQSGRYTIRVDVEDTMSAHYYDVQRVWFDNKKIHGEIDQVAGVPACSTVNLSTFAAAGADCSVPWPGDLLGIAYDEYIEEGNTAIPSDNYAMVGGVVQGGYALWIKKDGAPNPGVPIPVPGPGAPPWGPPFLGTTRVGDPGERCATADPPPGAIPPKTPGILASLDFRRLDAVCNPAEPGLTLERGECCGYNLRLEVWDNSVCPSFSGGHHVVEHDFPVCICNDLPRHHE